MTQVRVQYPAEPSTGNRPGRLWSLLEMLKVNAVCFVEASQFITATQGLLSRLEKKKKAGALTAAARKVALIDDELVKLRAACIPLDLKLTVKQIDRTLSGRDMPWPFSVVRESVKQVFDRFRDELEQRRFYALRPGAIEYYEAPRQGWDAVVARFRCSCDVEEARKCIALERYTAAVFHLCRVVERGVLELQMFLDKGDPKAHFSSVLRKLETLTQKQTYDHLPPHLRSCRAFLEGILAQLHAVKDAWRDKVSHVDLLVPRETFTEEEARGIHDATLLLMNKLTEGLPPRTAAP